MPEVDMNERCTCGTLLVEGASFCHRCGRPANGTVVIEEAVAPPPRRQPTQQEMLAALPVGFSNPVAVRVAFLMSLAIMMVQLIPGLSLLFVVWWVAAGWGGVLLYRRLTGLTLTVPSGARLGSLTGIITFVGMAVVFSMTMLFASKDIVQEMVKQQPEIAPVLNDPANLAIIFLMGLAMSFVLVVGLCAAGGALGARFTPRKADAGSAPPMW